MVTYHNSGQEPVDLNLTLRLRAASGQPVPETVGKLSADTVTVPAQGQATVTLTFAVQPDRVDTYTGLLTAASADQTVSLRTPVGAYQEPERYDLKVAVKDRTGAAPVNGAGEVVVLNAATGEWISTANDRFRLPAGRYAVLATVATPRPKQAPQLDLPRPS